MSQVLQLAEGDLIPSRVSYPAACSIQQEEAGSGCPVPALQQGVISGDNRRDGRDNLLSAAGDPVEKKK